MDLELEQIIEKLIYENILEEDKDNFTPEYRLKIFKITREIVLTVSVWNKEEGQKMRCECGWDMRAITYGDNYGEGVYYYCDNCGCSKDGQFNLVAEER